MKFIGKAKLTRQGQVTLPNEARKDLNIKLDSEIFWYEASDYLIVSTELHNENILKQKLINSLKKR